MNITNAVKEVEKLSIDIAKILKKLDKPGIDTSKTDVEKTNKLDLGISRINKKKQTNQI